MSSIAQIEGHSFPKSVFWALDILDIYTDIPQSFYLWQVPGLKDN